MGDVFAPAAGDGVHRDDRRGAADGGAGGDVWLLISSAGAQAAMQMQLVPTYAELPPGKAGLVAGGQGYLELAMYRASAAEKLKLKAGDLIHLGIGV